MNQETFAFERFLETVRKLRSPGGCPWDRQQTLETMTPFVVEEAYEVVDAIEKKNIQELKMELGDMLLVIFMLATIAEENNYFTLSDVMECIRAKLVYRHPHVFGNVSVDSAKEVLSNWEMLKDKESASRKFYERLAQRMPALAWAHKVQEVLSRKGFDWKNIEDVLPKLEEEIAELKEAIVRNKQGEIEEEMGDLLFSAVNVARFANVDPEKALAGTVRKFLERVEKIDMEAEKAGKKFEELSFEEMDALWEKIKKN